MKLNGKNLTIQETVRLTGKSKTTVYRWVKQGKVKSETVKQYGKDMYLIDIIDLESFLGYSLKQDETPPGTVDKTVEHSGVPWNTTETIQLEEIVQKAIDKALLQRETQMLKPLEEIAVYKVGRLEQLVEHLEAEKKTLREENEYLKNQMKVLPATDILAEKEAELSNIQSKLSEAEKKTQVAEKQVEKLEDYSSQMKHHTVQLQQEAIQQQQQTEHLEVQKIELEETLQKEKEEKLKKEEELLDVKSQVEQKEKEQIEIVEAWKKKVEELEKPWWKKLWK